MSKKDFYTLIESHIKKYLEGKEKDPQTKRAKCSSEIPSTSS